MRCLKRLWTDWPLFILVALLIGATQIVHAQNAQAEPVTLKLERIDNAFFLSTQLNFELPPVVEEALLKGIAIYFVAEVDVLRERWYWTNVKINSLQRHIRLAYHPLTRHWRLNVSTGDFVDPAQGIALNQNFDNLHDAMDGIRRMTRWHLAELADIDPNAKYFADFRFRLDLAQLPRPLQIGTLGQSDWQIFLNVKQGISMETIK
jgi:hypothetical protein